MASRIAVVTDSTAYLPTGLTDRYDIVVVPLQIIIGGMVRDESAAITVSDVTSALNGRTPVSTSRPAPQRFVDAYTAAVASGATGIVSIHLSADMSGTVESAMVAAREATVPVRVVDSGAIGMGLGFPVLAAAEAAARVGSLDQVAYAAETRAAATSSLFYVDTLEHLRRGGRIGAAATLVGSALLMKPLLHIHGGRIAPLEKVRTTTRAMTRLEELMVERAEQADALGGGGGVDIAVQHLGNPERAEELIQRLRARIPALCASYVGEVGAVIGAHVGPGMLAAVVAPAASDG